MKKYLLIFMLFSLSGINVQAQLPKIWDKRYGGSSDETIKTIVSLDNGNLIIGGYTPSNISGDKTVGSYGNDDYWVVCTDSNGIKLWDAGYGGSGDDELCAIIQTADGGFLVGGSSNSGISGIKTENCRGDLDYWVVKTDSFGNYQWDKRFGGTSYDRLNSICNTSDGGYLLAGISASGANGDKTQSSWGADDYWIVKLDNSGSKQWDKRFGGTNDDDCHSAYQISDHGYMLSGHSSSGANGDKSQTALSGSDDYWVVRIDSAGIKIWDKRFGTTSDDYAMSGVSDGKDGVVVGGYTGGGISGDKTQASWGFDDYWLVHVDSSGSKVWDARFGGDEDDDSFGNIFRTADGGYLSTGTSYSDISGNKTQANLGVEQTWTVKCDSNGNFIADRTLLTNGHEETGFATATKSGCIIIGNNTSVGNGGDKTQSSQGGHDYFIAKYCSPGMPSAGFTAPDTSICAGQCITFSDTSYNYPSAWSWSFPGGMPVISTLQNPTICYYAGGLYDVTLIVTNISGADTILHPSYINVSTLVSPNIVQNGMLLTCMPGASAYQWYFNYVLISGATNQTYNATQTGLYSVMATNSLGCSEVSQAFSFNINVALANFSVVDSLICQNDCIGFSDLSLNNPTSWLWSFPGGTPSSSTQQNPSNICYYSQGIYNVTLSVSNQYGSSFITYPNCVQAVPGPLSPVITQFYDTLFCNSNAVQFQWLYNGIPVPGATNSFYIIPVSGNYSVEITNSAGCSSVTTYNAIIPLPDFAAEDSMICEKLCTSFSDLSTNNPIWWSWIFDGGTPSSSSQQNPANICYLLLGTYDVTLITYDGYKYDTLFLEDYITVFPTPSPPSITIEGDTLISSVATAYQWFLDGMVIPGATNQSYVATQSGIYTIIIYSKDSCTAEVSIYLDLTSIITLNGERLLEIFPNPSGRIFHMKLQGVYHPVKWYVNDVMGELIPDAFPADCDFNKEITLDLKSQSDGVYFIHICYSDGCVIKKVVKQSTE